MPGTERLPPNGRDHRVLVAPQRSRQPPETMAGTGGHRTGGEPHFSCAPPVPPATTPGKSARRRLRRRHRRGVRWRAETAPTAAVPSHRRNGIPGCDPDPDHSRGPSPGARRSPAPAPPKPISDRSRGSTCSQQTIGDQANDAPDCRLAHLRASGRPLALRPLHHFKSIDRMLRQPRRCARAPATVVLANPDGQKSAKVGSRPPVLAAGDLTTNSPPSGLQRGGRQPPPVARSPASRTSTCSFQTSPTLITSISSPGRWPAGCADPAISVHRRPPGQPGPEPGAPGPFRALQNSPLSVFVEDQLQRRHDVGVELSVVVEIVEQQADAGRRDLSHRDRPGGTATSRRTRPPGSRRQCRATVL